MNIAGGFQGRKRFPIPGASKKLFKGFLKSLPILLQSLPQIVILRQVCAKAGGIDLLLEAGAWRRDTWVG